MLATFADRAGHRGTYALTSFSPDGPFEPLTGRPLTPEAWMCLDGTLFVDDAGSPWLVFAREWTQVGDADLWAQPLSPDLHDTAGDPVRLFSASEAPWTIPLAATADPPRWVPPGLRLRAPGAGSSWIAEGPAVVRRRTGELVVFWSSRSTTGSAIGVSRSSTGSFTGPWIHDERPVWTQDGAHPAITRTHDGQEVLLLHSPDGTPQPRPSVLRLETTAEGAFLLSPMCGADLPPVGARPGAPRAAAVGAWPDPPHLDGAELPAPAAPRSDGPLWRERVVDDITVISLDHDGSEAGIQRCRATLERLLRARRRRLRSAGEDVHVEHDDTQVRGWLPPPP